MTKTPGFHIRIDAFIPIDKKDFAKQAAAYQTIADIQKNNALPAGFFDTATIIGITPKQGAADIPEPASASETALDATDPASWPLTTDPLPEGATVLEATTDLGGNIFQTVRLADGSETFRRITVEQYDAEDEAEKPKPKK